METSTYYIGVTDDDIILSIEDSSSIKAKSRNSGIRVVDIFWPSDDDDDEDDDEDEFDNEFDNMLGDDELDDEEDEDDDIFGIGGI